MWVVWVADKSKLSQIRQDRAGSPWDQFACKNKPPQHVRDLYVEQVWSVERFTSDVLPKLHGRRVRLVR